MRWGNTHEGMKMVRRFAEKENGDSHAGLLNKDPWTSMMVAYILTSAHVHGNMIAMHACWHHDLMSACKLKHVDM